MGPARAQADAAQDGGSCMAGTMTRVTLAARPRGMPTPADFRIETAPVPAPPEGAFLARSLWLSLDPYMRGRMDDAPSYAPPVPLGGVMEGEAVAEVAASRHPDYRPGDTVLGRFGWATHALSDGTGVRRVDPALGPVSTALGVLGMPGHTAWVGLTEIAAVRAGETIVVSAATGAVGSLACQLARARGLRVIGVAGGAEKCAWAVEALGCHACLDHRAAPDAAALSAQVAAAAPGGVDVYFDNVGALTLAAVLPVMNPRGRIAVCGTIRWAGGRGADEGPTAPAAWRAILTRRLTARGFIVFDHEDSRPAFLSEVAPLLRAGRIVFRESVAEGIEAAPGALIGLLEGRNFGKQLVRVAAPS
jgi:NADPH-dependent curcumin reductase CurA